MVLWRRLKVVLGALQTQTRVTGEMDKAIITNFILHCTVKHNHFQDIRWSPSLT